MNEPPRRVIVGTFLGGLSHVTIPRETVQAAEAALDRAAEEKAAIRPELVVDARVFANIVGELRNYLEEARYTAIRRKDRYAVGRLARRLGQLRHAYQSARAKPYKRPPL